MPLIDTPDGTRIAALAFPGEGEVLYVHATGFCKETWLPTVESLPDLGGLAIDQRGHGDSSVPDPPFDWWDLGRDVLTAVDALGWRRTVGVGHSAGGAALVLAELMRPGTFGSLLLIEPIIFPPPFVRVEDFSMTRTALRRRAAFPSRAAALESFRGRGPFSRWEPSALRSYVDHGFREVDGAWVLKCAPEVEAEFYRSATAHGAWDRLGEVSCPVVVAGGEDSDSHPREFLKRQAAGFPDARAEIVTGATHFLPMERPGEVARLVGEVAALRRGSEGPGSPAAPRSDG